MRIKPELGKHQKIHCNTCKGETRHELQGLSQRGSRDLIYGDRERTVFWWETYDYRLWVCCGCDTGTLEVNYTASDWGEHEHSTMYPKRESQDWRPQKRFRQLDARLQSIYREVIGSYNAGLRILCSMGLRALMEGICKDKGITDDQAWGFEAKLEKLKDDKHLPPNIAECLFSFKFMGDDAAHRLETPTQPELRLGVEVMEDLLNFMYEAEYQLSSKADKLAELRSTELAESKKRREAKRNSSIK